MVRSWLLDLCAEILKDNEDLAGIAPVVADSGEGRWTALESIELGVPAPVITAALMSRFSSQGGSDYARQAARHDARGLRRARGRTEAAAGMIVLVMGVSGVGQDDHRRGARARARLALHRRRRLPPAGRTSPRWRPASPLQDEDRWPWLDQLNSDSRRSESNAVLACSALKESYRQRLGAGLQDFRIVYLHGSFELLRERIDGAQAPLHAGRRCSRASSRRSSRRADAIEVDVAAPLEDCVAAIVARL